MEIKLKYVFSIFRRNLLITIKRTFVFLCCLTAFSFSPNNVLSQNAKVKIDVDKTLTVEEVFSLIKAQTDYKFLYQDGIFKNFPKVEVKKGIVSANDLLEKSLSKGDFSILLTSDNTVLVKKKETINVEQEIQVSGLIIDEFGVPLAGASIVEKGTANGAQSDFDGRFTLNVSNPNTTIVISYIGFIVQEISLNGKSDLSITLLEDRTEMDEVVVVGYGTQKKANLTGAVDQISAKAIGNTPVGGIGEILQGQVANLNIGISDGKPGRNASFNIRGLTSLNGGSPLILIDGIPGGDINTIPSQDIQSVTVLKDAASAAIYGGRATFGVIMITTKKAKKGEFSIDYTTNYSLSKASVLPDIYTGDDYLDLVTEFAANSNHTYFTSAQIDYARQVAIDPSLPHAKYENGQLLVGGEFHNYYDEWFRDYTPKQQHNLSISSGGEKLKLRTSLDYTRTEGPLKLSPTIIDKYYMRSNLNYELNKNLSIYQNFSYTNEKSDIPDTDIYSFHSNVFRFLDFVWPMIPEYVDVNGEKVATNLGWFREYLGENSFQFEDWNNTRNTLGFDWESTNKEIKLHGDYTYESINWNKERFRDNIGPFIDNVATNRNNLSPIHPKFASEYFRSSYERVRNVVNLYGSIEKNIGPHYFKGLLGFNQEDFTHLKYWATSQSPINILPVRSLRLATGEVTSGDEDSSYALRSTFFRLNYGYKEKYLAEINGAYFLSSKFPSGNRASLQPSVSVGWVISKEDFFEPIKDVMNYMKFRASHGTLGNQDIGSFDYLEKMSIKTLNYNLDGSTVSYTSSPNPKSPNFTWEKATTIDFGLDMNFLNNKITTSFDVYERTTSGMLAKSNSLPSVFGAPEPKENNATLVTKGWEATINYKNQFNLGVKPFRYSFKLAVSDNTSEITKYENPTGFLGIGNGDEEFYEGQKIGEIWGLQTLGLFETDAEAAEWATNPNFWSFRKGGARAGDLKFEDRLITYRDENGEVVSIKDGVINNGDNTLKNPGDYSVIGNSEPRYQFGFTMHGEWNNFDFNAFFNGVGKRDFYPARGTNNFWSVYSKKYAVLLDHVVNDSWTEENPNAYFPRRRAYLADNHELSIPQTRYLQNAAYIRLKNVTFGYTIPKEVSRKIKIEKLRVYFNGQNLWEHSALKKYSLDPEGLEKDPDATAGSVGNGTAYPIARVYSLGVQVKF
jgi:TonB-linked SusC/RagA family outer membrane protein